MLCTDRDALVCDLAEVYGIYDYTSLPLRTVGTLAAGLGYNSRIKRKISGQEYSLETMLTASILDKLALLVYAQTEDARNGVNAPKSVLAALMGTEDAENEIVSYSTAEEYERARAELIKEIKDGE